MFNKVLIANRGAIACRVIRTLKALGVKSVAVYSEADANALHVSLADEAVCIGPAPATESYLRAERILDAARATGAEAIHPGYGFLSENPDFAEACAAAGIAFVGPTPEQMRAFGLKHTARSLAEDSGVPMLPGSGLLNDVGHARAEAARIGYPVMLKSTAGGGGIGMRLVWSDDALEEAYASVDRLARANFKEAGIFIEKYVEAARHIEVQVFGDGEGHVIALGERDCSVQRRNQKVIEETPAPGLSDAQRAQLHSVAVRLMQSVNYRSAGTVEFVMDASTGAFYFLEVNTRLQVEHGVTEQVAGVDLVAWMLQLAAGDLPALDGLQPRLRGASIQVRLYAEDPNKDFQPSSGLLTEVAFPADARIESAVVGGAEVTPYYDPMLAKLIVTADTRDAALEKLQAALAATRIAGIETNLDYLRQVVGDRVFAEGRQTTRYLNSFHYLPSTIDVIEPGVQTSVQDWPGRVGYWDVGVPPSGPMDALALRIGNRLLGNDEGSAALECTMSGPSLRFNCDTVFALTGAETAATLDGAPLAYWQTHRVRAGSVLTIGAVKDAGCRSYLCVRGGFDVPDYLGAKATFTLGQFGGHAGRTLRGGDVLHLCPAAEPSIAADAHWPAAARPQHARHWQIGVLYGPHGAPDFFTDPDIERFFATDWEVHYNSSRTGVRLIGPKPEWARSDGGEAGLHPSNIHDNAYAIGAIDFTGDMPVILGPDGPSLGGFVCPAVVVQAELWKLGQLRPGDTLRFVPVGAEQAAQMLEAQAASLSCGAPLAQPQTEALTSPILMQRAAAGEHPQVIYRQAGDAYLLVEYGPLELDLTLRFRAHALMEALQGWRDTQDNSGIIDLTPGIRSLQVHYDPRRLARTALLERLQQIEDALPAIDENSVPTRIVHLPLSWDDAATKLAIDKYMQSVRKDAPWCPSNIEFIRRINGLDSVDAVKRIVFDAAYLVLGLGDVYLGAPVATPLDPRHRLVTTKYNPARTWTPENAVGIGGAYLCVYGMEGPGGYQFVGRTVQMWNRWRQTADFAKPWLLRFFDQIRFYEVGADELLQLRQDFVAGRFQLKIEHSRFNLADYTRFLGDNAAEISSFKTQQQSAFDAERERWRAAGQAEYVSEAEVAAAGPDSELDLPPGARMVTAHVPGSVWKVLVQPGQRVAAGETLVIVESMKMEFSVVAPEAGEVLTVLCREGAPVSAGQDVLTLQVS
ncbi:urea carboxylase [Sinimarinibacterium sp. CAU 1509]|uniref:urea carboxylase n=1 Tax=Sinimarinibacterium sp. CAU 1509 TaxID=2562283 RepID=UPI0010ACE686|nr:urea carboxylase [Sinimarinibacterium sp. CAU 1509]TJY58380.1 urea carboxylase [Sinimarinibacterium sp. CAU 1509]